MKDEKLRKYTEKVLDNMPSDWLTLTTHRLDIYDESQAKTQFLEGLETLYQEGNTSPAALADLPTAYDYIRLGHPLSCLLEWTIAHEHGCNTHRVISFSSMTMPLFAILRHNKLTGSATRVLHRGPLPLHMDVEVMRDVYGFRFTLEEVTTLDHIDAADHTTVLLSSVGGLTDFAEHDHIDFSININSSVGSVVIIHGTDNAEYTGVIQHVRRRESIAMTPSDCEKVLRSVISSTDTIADDAASQAKAQVLDTIKQVTATDVEPAVGSSGLSIQYAIMMGLVDHAMEQHSGKVIKFVVPPNCYGGTNDQARRVAAAIPNVEIVDMLVDGDHDMVSSLDTILSDIADEDAIPYIIAEIPTNPRVEVPDLANLKSVLGTRRNTAKGTQAVSPVFILDQTFCPNVHFLGAGETLSDVAAISYASGSKFPSGGRCTAGYCAANDHAADIMAKVRQHLVLCDNEATPLQYQILAEQMPSMNRRIKDAYDNTRKFVKHINEVLPQAKINFVSDELAAMGFTPSVFSLDLPATGDTPAAREANKRALNHQLINLMITEIPGESKHCVSYGQLKGCYWTVPATSTQGTTKEGDKDYIVRAALSPSMDLGLHMEVFTRFVDSMG
jgi:hypothetical protein